MRKVVVSGATSMIGVALINECLKNGIEVLALVRPNTKRIGRLPNSYLLKIYEADISDDIKLPINETDFDVFYHFAWAHTIKNERNDPYLQEENIQSTLSAVKLAHKLGCKKFVGAGSQAEYGIVDDIISPTTPINPNNAYGITKYTAGKLSRILCSTLGLEHVWVRIFSVYGTNDNDNTLIKYVIEKLRNNEKPLLSSGEQMWDYLFEEDAGRAFYLIGQKSDGDKIYCLGFGKSKKLKTYVETIREIINPSIELGFGEQVLSDNRTINLNVDISDLYKDIGFIPTIEFEDGIKKMISIYGGQK